MGSHRQHSRAPTLATEETMTTIHTAQNNVTQLRVAFERLATCEQEDIATRFQDLACIIQAIQFDALDLKEERLIESEKQEYSPAF